MDKTTYKTGSLPTAAFLLATGYPMETYIRSGNHFEFVFVEKDGAVRKVASDYHKGALCSAVDFYSALIDIKRWMREAQETAQDRG